MIEMDEVAKIEFSVMFSTQKTSFPCCTCGKEIEYHDWYIEDWWREDGDGGDVYCPQCGIKRIKDSLKTQKYGDRFQLKIDKNNLIEINMTQMMTEIQNEIKEIIQDIPEIGGLDKLYMILLFSSLTQNDNITIDDPSITQQIKEYTDCISYIQKSGLKEKIKKIFEKYQ